MSAAAQPSRVMPDPAGAVAPVAETLALARPAGQRLALASLLGAAAAGAGIGLIATAAWLISRASQRPQEGAIAVGIVGVQFFGLSRGLFRYGQRLVSHDVAFRALAGLRVRFYKRIEALAPAGLPVFRNGDLLGRVVGDIDSLQDVFLRVIPPFVIAVLAGGATALLMWLILPAAGLILLVALLLAITLLTWLTGALARRSEARQAALRGELTAAVVDLVQGAPELHAYDAVGAQLRRTAAIDGQLTRIAHAAARTAGIGQGVATLLPGLAMWGALVAGIVAVRGGTLNGVLLAVIVLVPLAAFEVVGDLPGATQALERARRSWGRTRELTGATVPVADPAAPLPVPTPRHPRELCIRGLRVRYESKGRWVLDELDLDLAAGRTVAIVGRSGAGKSTLADVLLRFLPYEGGSITLDGVEIRDLCGDEYRRVVGLVSQDAHIFDTTIEENLRLARRGASDTELRSALERARLLEWIESLPDGLSTPVGAHGTQISGGQRQRLALARALLADFPLLVVDEPGEHLDTPTGDALLADLLETTPEQGQLVITHRLAGLEAVDEIIVLEQGQALERGTHADLVARDGCYARMWAREMGAVASPIWGDAEQRALRFHPPT